MMLTIFAALMLLLAAALTLIQVHVAASRAAVAADLAALSAADAARGLMIGEPCALAASTVSAHGATLDSCDISAPGVAYVQVRLASPLGLDATAESRAGPKQP
ncbi:secretion/DNA translocation related TadE-like protein [Enteractinococcus coprophilus]|uniref:Secretion/DNA translocation related TadE-like protein n=2 Tax=Enteractinococcus coprophilus TaxID=1027633 RepID=A0A543AM38_9MICC|nr:secretion/DNA translocation related TadE-like protein [Enteractinococcus coprophilus]